MTLNKLWGLRLAIGITTILLLIKMLQGASFDLILASNAEIIALMICAVYLMGHHLGDGNPFRIFTKEERR